MVTYDRQNIFIIQTTGLLANIDKVENVRVKNGLVYYSVVFIAEVKSFIVQTSRAIKLFPENQPKFNKISHGVTYKTM